MKKTPLFFDKGAKGVKKIKKNYKRTIIIITLKRDNVNGR